MKMRAEIVYTKSSCHNSIVVDNVSNGAMSTRYDMGSIGTIIICSYLSSIDLLDICTIDFRIISTIIVQ